MHKLYIPKYRHDYIDLKLQWFIDLSDLKNCGCPINCIQIIEKIYSSQFIPFQYGLFNLPDKFYAITKYNAIYNVYLMLINKNKINYPFDSLDSQLNFKLAHELAHIALDHLLIPYEAKTLEEIKLEEIEADEFAKRLLMNI